MITEGGGGGELLPLLTMPVGCLGYNRAIQTFRSQLNFEQKKRGGGGGVT